MTGAMLSRTDAASKHATQAYFDCLRAEVEHYGIGVTVVSPGYIQTNLSLNAVTGDGSKYGGKEEWKEERVLRYCDQELFQHYVENGVN